MKSIYTLVPDIEHFIETNEDWYAQAVRDLNLQNNTVNSSKSRGLRLSGLGDRCPRALWYSVHKPEMAEPLPYHALFKYGYGHIIEAMALSLARLAGHDVKGEQDELVVDGIVGHRDAVVDGCVLDVKSCSSLSFEKFKNKTLEADDAFGYLYQLDGYVLGSVDDPLVTVKDRGYFLAIDKTLGKMCLYEHRCRQEEIKRRITYYTYICSLDKPPTCTCGTKPVGASGNIGLDIKASYSLYKHLCFPELRTFIYANGPVYLTKVVRKPDVLEVDRYGKAI